MSSVRPPQASRLAAAILLVVLGLAGCATGGDRGGNAREGGSIAIGAAKVPTTLDPSLAVDVRGLQMLWLVYTPLLTYRRAEGQDGTDPVPGLARDLPEVSDGGLTYTLRLRRGLRYSNGTPVRAGDFERAVERVRELRSPLAPLYAGISSIDGDRRSGTIRVTLTHPDPAFPQILALPSSAPLPRGTHAQDLSAHPPPGLGPYRIARVHQGRRVVLVRARDFHPAGLPTGHVDSIAVVRAGSPGRQARAVISGHLDLMQEAAPTDLLPEIRSKYSDRYREDLTTSTVALIPDTGTPPLDDPAVRAAVSESLDGAKLVRLFKGLLESSCNFLPETVRGYRRLDPCPYGDRDEPADLVSAHERIEESGVQDAPVTVRAGPGTPPIVARYVVGALRKIGLDATVGGGAGARLRLERVAPLVPHPEAFVEQFARSTFDAGLSEAIAEGIEPSDGEEAEDAWASADERVVTQAYAVPLGTELQPTLLSERMDAENCARFHPVVGMDFSSLCLK
jgi:peptide/nickel transport system substrate-binding protein